MAANVPMIIPKKVQEGLISYHNQAFHLLGTQWNIRDQLRRIDLAYMRETDQTQEHRRAELANRLGDSDKYQNITVPVVFPQVEEAVTYQSSVFLTGNPLFGVVADPQYMDQALQMETLIDSQAIRGGWVRELQLFFRDGFKYNLQALEVSWAAETTPAFETDLTFSVDEARPVEVVWEGNKLRRLDPYNIFFDTRVNPADMYCKGEFAGFTELMSRVMLKDYINRLPVKIIENVIPAFESGLSANVTSDGIESYYVPHLNPSALVGIEPKYTTNWLAWAQLQDIAPKIQYKDIYEVTTLYARILPSDFNLKVPAANTPQVWKLVIVNHQILIYAERQTNAHGYLPILMGQPLEDGLGYQTKSFAQNAEPIQAVTSAMMNSVIAARRRAISDRGLYDPSRVSEHHINNPSPTAKIPVRPSAYGKPLSEAYFPIPFNDNQSGLTMQEIQQLIQMGNIIGGQNQARQGQFVKGNKSRKEFSDIMSHSSGRDRNTSMLIQAQIFTPMKHMLKTNILQYQGGTSLYSRAQDKEVKVDPVQLRKAAMEFQLSDGLTPSEKLMDGEEFAVALQTIQAAPNIGQQYNVAPMFSYLMKTRGVNLKPFEKSAEQVAYEQALEAWTQSVENLKEVLMKVDPMQQTELWNKLPPQPVPEQYGYKPQEITNVSSPNQ